MRVGRVVNMSNIVQPLSVVENQLEKHAINVHKFGGSSLASIQCIERVVDIICRNCQLNDVVVVSANGDTTDALFHLLDLAENKSEELVTEILALEQNQKALICGLLNDSHADRICTVLAQDIEQLTFWLQNAPLQHQSDILAYGELWSARILSAVLNERICPSYYIDSRDFLLVNNHYDLDVNNSTSRVKLTQLKQLGKLAVVTGYIAKDSSGNTCTLGRNGSDYSATIIAALSDAKNVTLWTDVDGIYSADPRVVPLARKLHRLPNGVAKELGRLGNPVLHAKTLKPLTEHRTHLHVASSFDAEKSGTEIGKFGQIAKQELSVTYLNDLLLAQSTSFLAELGDKAKQEFDVICADNTQGFVVINQHQQKALSQWLASHDTEVEFTPVSIIATVGHKVTKHGDIKARFKRALKSSKPLKLVDSESNHSVIAVLADVCTTELLNSVHHAMTKDAKHIGVVVAGLGNIGQCFLDILPKQMANAPALENVHLVGLVTSKKALINNDGIDVLHAMSLFEKQAQNYDKQQLVSWLENHPYDELIVIDITPSEHFSQLYQEFFQQGIHVIGANKWAASAPTETYNLLRETAEKHHSLWLGNATVGAGLPINHAISDLKNSGDNIIEISGIFSGTLSWLFETYDAKQAFSTLLKDALKQGITEPDPREDLSGRDVQRKLLILARLAGYQLSLSDISVQNLVPESLQAVSLDEFLSRANELDDYFLTQYNAANEKDSCIRYIARFNVSDNKVKAKVSLEVLKNSHAFAQLTPCDNVFQITSQWYQDNPLIIRGPGAGREVTAGGIHSDLVNICQQLATRKLQVKIKGINE